MDQSYPLNPENNQLIKNWSIFAYDESVLIYSALEGDLMFCSSAVIKIEDEYAYNLTVLPFFFTSIKKLAETKIDGINFTKDPSLAKKMAMVEMKTTSILDAVEPNSIVLIDGPLVAGNIMAYLINMDEKLREKNCIPIYFIKNSYSRMVIDFDPELSTIYNSDFHWAVRLLPDQHRSSLFKYTDQYNPRDSKVFTYLKPSMGFPMRIEMHSKTYEKFNPLIKDVIDLLSYFFILQGDYANPQVRPIVIAEKYAREGLKVLNIPALLQRLGFHPTINQVRFG